ncbi:MAG TPA: metallophosphoesterase [Pseudosphingobacterium sp.]|nr:metallophosphoesterase [Pseudosphingobacterium sp.]
MNTNRRNFLKGAGLLSASSMLAFSNLKAFAIEKGNKGIKRQVRVAHLTDIHLLDAPTPKAAFAKVLKEVNASQDRPDIIINTGDSLMDMNNQPKDKVSKLWSAWDEVIQHNHLPMKSCIGNHDVWYISKDDANYLEASQDALYGKAWIKSKLKLPHEYYAFDLKGWKFIALDSIHYVADKGGYTFGQEQLEWLKEQLVETPKDTPVLIFSHVPIISVTPLLYAAQRKPAKDLGFPGGDQHVDVIEVKKMLKESAKVRVALSGHVHYVDSVDYLGVNYCCGGAVSGNWWDGILDDFPPAYSILDLYEDGSSRYETIYY